MVTGAPRGVKAKAGILADATTGQVLWSSGGNTERPIASITKVMTALIVLRAGNLNRPIRIPKSVIAYVTKYGANSAGLVPGQVLTAGELLHALLLVSACDAAYTLATAYGPGLPAFIAKMNATAARLGLTHTHFTSPDGLPYPTETSTYSTPAELLKLGELAMQSAAFRSIVGERFYNLPQGRRPRPLLVGELQRADRLLPGRDRHQDRLHRRGGPLPALRGRPRWPHPDRRRPRQPANGPRRRRPRRRQGPELGLLPQTNHLTRPSPAPSAPPRAPRHERPRHAPGTWSMDIVYQRVWSM